MKYLIWLEKTASIMDSQKESEITRNVEKCQLTWFLP